MTGRREKGGYPSFDEAVKLIVSIGAIVIGALTTIALGIGCKLGEHIKRLQQTAKSRFGEASYAGDDG